MVRYKDILQTYFTRLKDFCEFNSKVGMATAELSFRTYLDEFFLNLCSDLNPSIRRIFEPRAQGRFGRPDWLFTDAETMGVYGYVEAKGLSTEESIDIEEYHAQILKYLNLGNPVILTDGIEFVYFDVNGAPERFCLFAKPVDWDNPLLNVQSIAIFQKFFSKIGFRAMSEQMVIEELSKRAKLLCGELLDLLSLEEEEAETETELSTVRTLKKLWDIASTNLDVSLQNDKTFAGFISQILAFGLLYAHRFISGPDITPVLKYDKLHGFWTQKPYVKYSKHMRPFVYLFNALSEELDSKLSRIGIWYDNTRRFLSFIELKGNKKDKPNFHQLYEAFLKAYDNSTRINFGIWYTPFELADFLVRLVRSNILSNYDFKQLDNRPFHVIDPCCGTGTFLEAVLDNIPLPNQSKLAGFEILPVPYALANYRLSMYSIPDEVTLAIHLTNTLGDNTFLRPKYDFSSLDSVGLFFAKEQVASYALSKPPLTIIIGNPPCSDSSVTNAGNYLEKLMMDFRPPIRRGRQNIQKQLTNEWIKFLRWGLYKGMKSRPSILAFILPSAFAANVSFKYARKFLAENANEISIIEFDSDNRVESSNQNVFNTLQGRLLVVASFSAPQASPHIKYKDLRSFNRAEKLTFFAKPIEQLSWKELLLNEDYVFRPTGEYDDTLYSRFIPLAAPHGTEKGIFLRNCSGMKLAPTHLLVHFSKGQLSRRCKYIGDISHSYEDIKTRWYSGQAKPPTERKLTLAVRNAISVASRNSTRYSYRPFLEAYVNDDESLLNELRNTSGGGMRDRPEVRSAYSDASVFGFAVAPAPAEISSRINKFCSFCWWLPDNDLSTRGNAHVFCNKFPDYKKGAKWNAKVEDNVNSTLVEMVGNLTGTSRTCVQDEIVFYAYAVLSSPYFLSKFSAKLHSLAGQTPAIPLTADKHLYSGLVRLGKRLAELEKGDYKLTDIEEKRFESLKWNNAIASFELKNYGLNDGKIELTTTANVVICLDVPLEVLEFSVSGYGVIREWLKYHSYSYYRKPISTEEISELFSLIARIQLYILEYPLLDKYIEGVLEKELMAL